MYSCYSVVIARDGPSIVLVNGGGLGWLIGVGVVFVIFVVVSWCVDEVPVFEFLGWLLLLVVEFFVFFLILFISVV